MCRDNVNASTSSGNDKGPARPCPASVINFLQHKITSVQYLSFVLNPFVLIPRFSPNALPALVPVLWLWWPLWLWQLQLSPHAADDDADDEKLPFPLTPPLLPLLLLYTLLPPPPELRLLLKYREGVESCWER